MMPFAAIELSEELALMLLTAVVGALAAAVSKLYLDLRNSEAGRRGDLERALTVIDNQSAVLAQFRDAFGSLTAVLESVIGAESDEASS